MPKAFDGVLFWLMVYITEKLQSRANLVNETI